MMALSFHDRQKLYDRINLRVTKMVEDGIEQEARWLLENGYGKTSFQAIGYKEMGAYLAGEETLEQACEHIRQESRRYAKRQLTWFRREQDVRWIARDHVPDRLLVQEAARIVAKELEISYTIE